MIEIHTKEGYYGIKENGTIIVPFVHFTEDSAIEEWEYFQRLNIDERQFLSQKRTHEEVDKIVKELKTSKTITSKQKEEEKLYYIRNEGYIGNALT